jgi:hypothetical protein
MSSAEMPTPAGIYDYILGGTNHTAADREAAQRTMAAAPEARSGILANRGFMQRAVRFAAVNGIRQFIDLGSGYPAAGPVHEVAAAVLARPRVVYVDYDPAVVTLIRKVVGTSTVAAAGYDVREPERIIASPEVTTLIDWSEPVAVLMVALLHFVTDEEDPARIVSAFRQRMASGSYLVLSHASFGENPDGAQLGAGGWSRATSQMTIRSREAIRSFFSGLELAGRGLVTAQEWGTSDLPPHGQAVVLAGVGRVP